MSTSETPRTAKLMSIVSHNPAVIITGNVLTRLWLGGPLVKNKYIFGHLMEV